MSYSVRIEYQEPTYAARRGEPPRTYGSTFHVLAADVEEATRLAMQEFRHIERLSSVGWTRDVVRVVAARDA